MLFSKSTRGVYDAKIHKAAIPDDALDIPDELYEAFKRGEFSAFDVTEGVVVRYSPPVPTLADLRKNVTAEIKGLRQAALDAFARSAGVSEMYSENLKAAQAANKGAGASTLMRDGTTADAYLAAMAAGMGVSAAQFCAYVLAENATAATKAREIEAEYLRVAYTFLPAASFEEVQAAAESFRQYCTARTGA